MDYVFSPWRYSYVTSADRQPGCVFCGRRPMAESVDDPSSLIVYHGRHCYILCNAYPYTSGHVMVIPYEHMDRLELLATEAANEMMALAQRMERVLRELYQPDGINLGMNIGKAAGAGVAGHIHLHALPRWVADANFMTVIGETRILPESLETTAQRIREALKKS